MDPCPPEALNQLECLDLSGIDPQDQRGDGVIRLTEGGGFLKPEFLQAPLYKPPRMRGGCGQKGIRFAFR